MDTGQHILANKREFRLLQIAVFFIFLGRAWQHWVFRQSTYSDLFDLAGILVPEAGILLLTKVLSALFFAGALSALIFHRYTVCKYLIYFATLGILLYGIGDQAGKLPYYNQFPEHTIQYLLPLLLVFFPAHGTGKKWLLLARLAIVGTFTAHGLYALNWVPVPASFIAMTHHITGLEEADSRIFLWIAGFLDLVLSILIFVPKLRNAALLYATFWGFATALARIWGHVHLGWEEVATYWVPEFMLRLGNAILPMVLFLLRKGEIRVKDCPKKFPV